MYMKWWQKQGRHKSAHPLKADSNMPSFIKYTPAALHDQQFYECIKELPDGSIITFDKAYINYL